MNDLIKKTCLIVGCDSIDESLIKYCNDTIVKPYVKYLYSDKDKLKEIKIDLYQKMYETCCDIKEKERIKSFIKLLKDIDSDSFYNYITYDCTFDENKNAISTINENGKFDEYFITDLIMTNDKIFKSESKLKYWDNNPTKETIFLLDKLWSINKENLKEDDEILDIYNNIIETNKTYFDNFKDKNEYITIHKPIFDSLLINDCWFDFDKNIIEDKLKFYEILNKIDGDTKITSITYL